MVQPSAAILWARAVARAVVKKVNCPELLSQVVEKGEELKRKLEVINRKLKLFTDIRGKGLMIGAELKGRLARQSR